MIRHRKSWRVLRCVLGVSCLLWLACSIPDLDHTLFSCTTSDDCAPGQVCERYQGDLVCRRPLESSSQCPEGICSALAAGGRAGLPTPAVLDAGASAGQVCRVDDCTSGISLSPAQREPQALEPDAQGTDAGVSPVADTLDAAPDATAATPAGSHPGDASAADPVAEAPRVRFDFETGLEGWRSVLDQRPEDTLDGTEQSTELAHHGTGALRMVFDGEYTPVAGVDSADAFYGAYEIGAPPAGTEVSLWMLSTAPDVSVEVSSQAGTSDVWLTLAAAQLPQNEWREISLTMPLVDSRQFGVLVRSELDLEGFIYLDEIRW